MRLTNKCSCIIHTTVKIKNVFITQKVPSCPTQPHLPQEQPFFSCVFLFSFNHRLVLPFLESCMNGVTVYTLLCLASFSQPNVFAIFAKIAIFISHLFLFYRWVLFHYMNIPQYFYPFSFCFISGLEILGIKPLWVIFNKYFCGYMLSISFGLMPRSGMLGYMVGVCLTSLAIDKISSKVVVLFFMPISAVWEF